MRRRLVFFLLALSVYGCASIQNKPILKPLSLQGHRGARGLYPENTWPAMKAAIEHGMNTIELDTILTRDKRLIIFHDRLLTPNKCALSGQPNFMPVETRSLTVKQLKKYDCGHVYNPEFPKQKLLKGLKLMTLEELFLKLRAFETTSPARVQLNIEAKIYPNSSRKEIREHAKLILQRLRDFHLEKRAILQSFSMEFVRVSRNLFPEGNIAALFSLTKWEGFLMISGFGDAKREEVLQKAILMGANIISPHYFYINAEYIRDCHEKGLAVIPWTVNSESKMSKMLEQGVDGIITDYPNVLARVYALHGQHDE